MKKKFRYLFKVFVVLFIFGGALSIFFNKDIAEVEAKDVEISLNLMASEFITSSGYKIPTDNKWNVELGSLNTYNVESKSVLIPKGTTFQAHISASDNSLVQEVSKFHFSFAVDIAGSIKEVEMQTYNQKYEVLSTVSFTDTSLTSYSGDLIITPSTYKGLRLRVEPTGKSDINIYNFSMNAYEDTFDFG